MPAYSACWLCVCVGGEKEEVCLHGNRLVLNLWHVRLTTDVLAHFNSWCQSGIYCVHIKLGSMCKCFESLRTSREESGGFLRTLDSRLGPPPTLQAAT